MKITTSGRAAHRIPTPINTPSGPAYQGRLLDHPDEEVVDQGAPFDITTLLSRRRVLSLGAGAAALAACSSGGSASESTSPGAATNSSPSATSSTAGGIEIPDETAGPYPADGSNGPDVLEQSGIVRGDITSSIDGSATAEGVPLAFEFQVIDMADDTPMTGVAIYAWHCTAAGEYSMYSSGLEDVTYLRGVQETDADGRAGFTSIYPGCYSGRWPHIHFEVYPDVTSITDASAAIAGVAASPAGEHQQHGL